MGARYYQPSIGRFTQLDPHPHKLLDVNRYAYAGCNPANYSDPSGLMHCTREEIFWKWAATLISVEVTVAATAVMIVGFPESLAMIRGYASCFTSQDAPCSGTTSAAMAGSRVSGRGGESRREHW